jgi:hypothetical protein
MNGASQAVFNRSYCSRCNKKREAETSLLNAGRRPALLLLLVARPELSFSGVGQATHIGIYSFTNFCW